MDQGLRLETGTVLGFILGARQSVAQYVILSESSRSQLLVMQIVKIILIGLLLKFDGKPLLAPEPVHAINPLR